MEDPVPGEESAQENGTLEEETPNAPEEAAEGEGEEEETHGQDAGDSYEDFAGPPDEEPSEEKKYFKAEQLSEELREAFQDLGKYLKGRDDLLTYLQEQLGEGGNDFNFEINGREVNIQLCDELHLSVNIHLTVMECPGKKSAQPEESGNGGQE